MPIRRPSPSAKAVCSGIQTAFTAERAVEERPVSLDQMPRKRRLFSFEINRRFDVVHRAMWIHASGEIEFRWTQNQFRQLQNGGDRFRPVGAITAPTDEQRVEEH